ncbi:MAG TPA: hypothetical protein VF088_06780 [Pyrinomonadaceae bacterium]
MKTRTEITVEMDRLVVIQRSRRTAWCSSCSRCVEMLNVDDAAIFARVNSRTIFRWAESGVVHSSETPEGLLLICPNSIVAVSSVKV